MWMMASLQDLVELLLLLSLLNLDMIITFKNSVKRVLCTRPTIDVHT